MIELPIFAIVNNVLLQIFHKCLMLHMYKSHLGVAFLCCVICECDILQDSAKLFSKVITSNYTPSSSF